MFMYVHVHEVSLYKQFLQNVAADFFPVFYSSLFTEVYSSMFDVSVPPMKSV